jgi:hypothetical protein
MGDQSSHIPWPVWAAVSICVALIGAWALLQSGRPIGPTTTTTTPARITDVQPRPSPQPVNSMSITGTEPYLPATATASMGVTPQPVHFTIHDTLGSRQVAEEARILLDGVHVGTLLISTDKPSATLHIKVPAPGRYSWSVSATAVFLNANDQSFMYSGSGQGIILVDENSSFDLRGTYSGPTWTINLERDNAQ